MPTYPGRARAIPPSTAMRSTPLGSTAICPLERGRAARFVWERKKPPPRLRGKPGEWAVFRIRPRRPTRPRTCPPGGDEGEGIVAINRKELRRPSLGKTPLPEMEKMATASAVKGKTLARGPQRSTFPFLSKGSAAGGVWTPRLGTSGATITTAAGKHWRNNPPRQRERGVTSQRPAARGGGGLVKIVSPPTARSEAD